MGRHQTKKRSRIRKAKTRSIISKLLHNTIGNNSKNTWRNKRDILKKNYGNQSSERVNLKIGSINVNGLGQENNQAVLELLSKRELDVSKFI